MDSNHESKYISRIETENPAWDYLQSAEGIHTIRARDFGLGVEPNQQFEMSGGPPVSKLEL